MRFYYHFIVNGSSGSGKGLEAADKIKKIVEKNNFPHHFYFSEYAGHEILLTDTLVETSELSLKEAAFDDYESLVPLLIVIGGDGTIHNILNHLYLKNIQLPVGYIPAGSGNDFARSLAIPREPEKAFWHINKTKEPRQINLICYEEKIQEEKGIALNNLGIGLDAAIVNTTNHSSIKSKLNKYNLGSFAYLSSVVRVLFRQKGFPILLEVNGQQFNFKKAFLCTTTNHPYFGGGVAIAPTANVEDDSIDFVLVERVAMVKILWLILLLTKKRQMNSRYFHHMSAEKVRIVSTIPTYGQVDGEEMGKRPFDLIFSTAKQSIWG